MNTFLENDRGDQPGAAMGFDQNIVVIPAAIRARHNCFHLSTFQPEGKWLSI